MEKYKPTSHQPPHARERTDSNRAAWQSLYLSILTTLPIAEAKALSIVNAGAHADTFIAPAVIAVLGSNPFSIDYDPAGSITALANNFTNTSYPFVQVQGGTATNHAPYQVLNASLCAYSIAYERSLYPTLLAGGGLYTIPQGAKAGVCGVPPAGTPPGVLLTAVTSTNSGDGASAWGVEFAFSASYKGLNTTADSWDSAAMAGLYAALLSQHPTFNAFDAKAAFRQTASNWATGYASNTYGFGILDYDSASALSSSSTLWLQGPQLQVQTFPNYAQVTLIPFRQTRRTQELLYSVSASYVWPVKNEYTATDLAASGATLLYTSNGTDVLPSYTFVPAASGTVTFVAFTTDGSNHYSRVESYSSVSATITVGTLCNPP